jgi:H+-translocating NAD(P) transhydrogenase subunit beta
VRTARRGNLLAAGAMLLAVVATLLELGLIDYRWILAGVVVGGSIGLVAAVRVPMTSMPEMVAIFNGCGGGASALVALSILYLELVETPTHGWSEPPRTGAGRRTRRPSSVLSILIGGVTFSGSVIAYLKLAGKVSGQAGPAAGRHLWNAAAARRRPGAGRLVRLPPVAPAWCSAAALVVTASSPCCSASCWSSRSAAPTCRW